MEFRSGENVTKLIILTLLSMTSLAAMITFSSLPNIPNNGIFNNSMKNISDKYETYIVPEGYAFSIWGLIYLWQIAWIVYALTTICRTNSHGPVMMNPVVLPAKVHIFYILSCALSIAWLFLWDWELMECAFVSLLCLTLCGYAAVTFHSKATLKYESQLSLESKSDLICIRILIQNGMDLFYSWTTVATLLNLSIALTYGQAVMSDMGSSILCLCILGVLVIGWSVAENTIFFDLFCYVYSWYFILIWALTGIIVKDPDTSNLITLMSIVLLCITIICLVAKIVVYFVAPPSKKYKSLKQGG